MLKTFMALSVVVLALSGPAAGQDIEADAWQRIDTDRPVVGQFVRRGSGLAFVPQDRQLPAIGVTNPDRVAPTAVGTMLSVQLEPEDGQRAVVSAYSVATDPAVTAVMIARVNTPDRPRMAPEASTPRAIDAFRRTINSAIQPGAMSAELASPNTDSEITRARDTFISSNVSQYTTALESGDTAARNAAVADNVEVRRVLKGIFGNTDNYSPWTYDRIHERSRSVAAIADGIDSRVICSGFLIFDHFVMTAGHCLAQHEPSDLEIWFGFEESSDGTRQPPKKFRVTDLAFPSAAQHDAFLKLAEDTAFHEDMLDVAVLRFDGDSCEGCDTSFEMPDPACLRSRAIRRDSPLYVVGYPRGNDAKVHDNAWVYLQHRISKRELDKLRLDLETDFAALEPQRRQEIADEFLESYRPVESDPRFFTLHDPQFGSQPKFGLIADTFQGNSGSPVFFRSDHCIAGVFIGGVEDTGRRLTPSWLAHETALPMSAVIAAIRNDPVAAPLVEELDIR